jgi:hypothetical protein
MLLFPLGISKGFFSHFALTRDRKREKRRKLEKNKINK